MEGSRSNNEEREESSISCCTVCTKIIYSILCGAKCKNEAGKCKITVKLLTKTCILIHFEHKVIKRITLLYH